ncbi:Aminopeptidase O, partial [Ophiophagus hannah]
MEADPYVRESILETARFSQISLHGRHRQMELDITTDDLPLMANTNHMLVKHYVLDLDVDFRNHVIEGTLVIFLEPVRRHGKGESKQMEGASPSWSDETCCVPTPEACSVVVPDASACTTKSGCNDFAVCGKGENDTSDKNGSHGNREQASGISSSKNCCDIEIHGSEDFLLVLDCCDLCVLKVEEVDVAVVPGIEKCTSSAKLMDASKDPRNLRNRIVHELVTLPTNNWREQLQCYKHCSQAPACGELLFMTGAWSLEIRKAGIKQPEDFPRAIRIWYKTKPEGQSLSWIADQSDRPCVYTVGSPINNRALFPCQEPPVAMSTWQATVRADACFVVLMSGENVAEPAESEKGVLSWFYYVTMPMPASTFAIAVGCWAEVKRKSYETDVLKNDGLSSKGDV